MNQAALDSHTYCTGLYTAFIANVHAVREVHTRTQSRMGMERILSSQPYFMHIGTLQVCHAGTREQLSTERCAVVIIIVYNTFHTFVCTLSIERIKKKNWLGFYTYDINTIKN